MPALPDQPRLKGISLPPSGWALAVLLSLYIFTGLIGHDPWKHDDAVTIGIVFDMLSGNHWLVPHLAGQPYPDAPLYYWLAALFAKLFSWLLPTHDAVRLASGLCTLLALQFILLAARELHGKEFSAVAPLALAGSIGFLYHAHEAQPMLAALTAHTAAYWALVLWPRRQKLAAVTFAAALAAAFLANGLLPILTLVPAVLATLWFSENRSKDMGLMLSAIALGAVLCAAWLLPLEISAPEHANTFLQRELSALSKPVHATTNLLRYLNLLLWYAWPALPLAAWALWSKRRLLATRAILLPTLSFALVLLILAFIIETRSAPALLLLPPLVLVAVPGVSSLRRGAANAFDWFGMMTFTVFAAVAWIVWNAMVFGWPERLARQAVRLEPGFLGRFDLLTFAFALVLTLIWFWLIFTSPRSKMRGIMHWMAGLTLFWILVAVLWMPWIDYGKTYRPLSADLAKTLPAKAGCIANLNLPDSILATLDYFNGIRTTPFSSEAGKQCNWLLVQGEIRDPALLSSAGWYAYWEGKRPSDRRAGDKFHLYRRNSKNAKPLPEEIEINDATEPAASPR